MDEWAGIPLSIHACRTLVCPQKISRTVELRTLLVYVLLSVNGLLSAQTAENMTLLGIWDDTSIQNYSDVWGYAADGKEYAIIGSRNFFIILDVTDPADIIELHRVNSYVDSGTRWRDIKVYGGYAYCVEDLDTREGLQIIDLGDLENTPTEDLVVYSSQADFAICHNITIDTTVSPPKLYAFGTNTERNGVQIFSLADPTNPVRINSGAGRLTGGYVHDGYAVNDTLYANSEGRGMYVYDMRNPMAPVEVGILAGYEEAGYNHSSWRTADGRYVALCDETLDTGVKMIDVQDPADMEVASLFRSTLLAPAATNSVAHNPYILGDSLLVLSYYDDGVQVWDINDPTNPTRLGYYDTTPNSTRYGFKGVWGAYPYLPSGNILASDTGTGLYVIRYDGQGGLPVTYRAWNAAADSKDVLLTWSITGEAGNAGWSVEHAQRGHDFAEIAFVEPGKTDYSLAHASPGAGTHYYRLRQLDANGGQHLSEVRTVELFPSPDRLAVFPNPAPAFSQISFQGLADDVKWEVWTADGRLLRHGRGRSTTLSAPPGVYLLRTEAGATEKIVLR